MKTPPENQKDRNKMFFPQRSHESMERKRALRITEEKKKRGSLRMKVEEVRDRIQLKRDLADIWDQVI